MFSALQQAAPWLENNPCKIKRFINHFRLLAYIAKRRLLLPDHVSVKQLANWLVLCLR